MHRTRTRTPVLTYAGVAPARMVDRRAISHTIILLTLRMSDVILERDNTQKIFRKKLLQTPT